MCTSETPAQQDREYSPCKSEISALQKATTERVKPKATLKVATKVATKVISTKAKVKVRVNLKEKVFSTVAGLVSGRVIPLERGTDRTSTEKETIRTSEKETSAEKVTIRIFRTTSSTKEKEKAKAITKESST